MKLHQLTKLENGQSILMINLTDEIMLDERGNIMGIAQTSKKVFKSFCSDASYHYMKEHYGKSFKGQMILMAPEITISNWNNTLWDSIYHKPDSIQVAEEKAA